MSELYLPPYHELADDKDTLGWDIEKHGRMADYATADDEVETFPFLLTAANQNTRLKASPLGLPSALAARGLRVEVIAGWQTRTAGSFNPWGAVCHWTAGPVTGDRPSLNICIYGRTDLAGPLCNVFLTRSGVAVVVAAGRANHAGEGSWYGVVGNSAMYGTEAENSGGGEWTNEQRYAYPRINAAYLDLIGTSNETRICGHNEWAPYRKIDIRDWPMPAMRTQVSSVLSGATGDTMSAEDVAAINLNTNTRLGIADKNEQDRFAKNTAAILAAIAADPANPLQQADLDAAFAKSNAEVKAAIAVNNDALLAALKAELATVEGVDPAMVETVFRKVLGGVDNVAPTASGVYNPVYPQKY